MDYGEIDSENTAIKGIKRMIADGVISQEDAEKYYPELKESEESEDERIRKALVKYFTSRITNLDYEIYGIPFKEVLAWLEKTKPNPYTGVGFKYNGQTYGMCARDGGVDILVDSKLISHIDVRQGELETELKIEKGKWYICISQFCNCIEGRVYKATSDSRIIDDFGTEYDMHSDAYKYFRLWTIQDAKDGDVLSYRNGQWIFIYKEKIDDSSFYYHTLYSTIHQDLIIDDIGFTLLDDSIVPATKEQRGLLFQKMKEAGYKWDAEKKELKKIEQKSADWLQELEDKLANATPQQLAELEEKYFKEEPAEWSGDDLKMLDEMYEFFDKHKIPSLKHNMDDYAKFIKSLKDRVQPQPKQEWSEEDRKIMRNIIDDIHCGTNFNPKVMHAANEREKWFKSICMKYQSKWKPSESQMKWLHDAIESTQYEPRKQALISLYSDLMGLKD